MQYCGIYGNMQWFENVSLCILCWINHSWVLCSFNWSKGPVNIYGRPVNIFPDFFYIDTVPDWSSSIQYFPRNICTCFFLLLLLLFLFLSFNSLAPGRFEQDFRSVIFKLFSVTDWPRFMSPYGVTRPQWVKIWWYQDRFYQSLSGLLQSHDHPSFSVVTLNNMGRQITWIDMEPLISLCAYFMGYSGMM